MKDLDMLNEHQAVNKSKNDGTEAYAPSAAERKLKKKVDQLFEKAKKHRSKYDNKWLEYYKFYRGVQWPTSRPTYMHSEVFNFIFQIINSQIPILVDKQPRFDFIPTEPSDFKLSDILSNLAAFDWKRNNWMMTLIENLYDAHIYGTCFASLQGKMEKGKGKIDFESEDPFYCFPDPEAHSVNKKAGFFIVAKPLSVQKARKKYKDKENSRFIKADLIDLIGGDKTDLGKARFQSPIDKKSAVEASRETVDNLDAMALEITAYFKDDSIIEEKKRSKYIQKKKYAKGRMVTFCGGVMVKDEPYPYEDFDQRFAPYANMQNYVLPRELFGVSEIEQLEGPQKVFNKIVSFTLDVLTLMGNPVWVVDTAAGIDTDALNNRPGLIIEKEKGSEVRRDSGAQLQPYVLAILDRVQNYINEISGSTDVSRGVRPDGVNAAAAIRALQDASQTRLRLKGQLIDMYLQEIGQMYLSRVFQFYTAPFIYRITNDDDSFRYFKMMVEPEVKEDEDGEEYEDGFMVKVSEIVRVGNEQFERDPEVFRTKGVFDVQTTVGSGLPFAKAERVANAYQLYDRELIDNEAVLDDIGYPNKEKVLNRMQEKQQAQMEQQLALQQQMQAQQAVPQQQ